MCVRVHVRVLFCNFSSFILEFKPAYTKNKMKHTHLQTDPLVSLLTVVCLFFCLLFFSLLVERGLTCFVWKQQE